MVKRFSGPQWFVGISLVAVGMLLLLAYCGVNTLGTPPDRPQEDVPPATADQTTPAGEPAAPGATSTPTGDGGAAVPNGG
jgi:hypothetical protein